MLNQAIVEPLAKVDKQFPRHFEKQEPTLKADFSWNYFINANTPKVGPVAFAVTPKDYAQLTSGILIMGISVLATIETGLVVIANNINTDAP